MQWSLTIINSQQFPFDIKQGFTTEMPTSCSQLSLEINGFYNDVASIMAQCVRFLNYQCQQH